jgi:hypothetical protein
MLQLDTASSAEIGMVAIPGRLAETQFSQTWQTFRTAEDVSEPSHR